MDENPYEPPSKEIESLPKPSPQGWTWHRWLLVLGLSPITVVIWIVACFVVGATMMALNWPPASIRQRIGGEWVMGLAGGLGAIPAIAFQVAVLRLSRRLARKRDISSEVS
jgi:hypothetical protein